jgi:hypothetical protein
MAFNAELAERIRGRLKERAGFTEKKMFGGVTFLLNGNMCCGVRVEEIIVRLPPSEGDQALSQPNTKQFVLNGRPLKGWILVGTKSLETDPDLAKWVDRAADFVGTLPPK